MLFPDATIAPAMDLEDAIRTRRSTKSFRTNRPVTDGMLRRIFDLVRLSPTSYNLQHQRFVVVRDHGRRQRLMEACYGQKHVGEAPCVVVVAARLDAHTDAARANGHAPREVLDRLVPFIERSYADRPQLQRDEAIRSASLASMTLMLVATAEGLATCPMIGFDPAKVREIAALDDRHIPVMLIVLGVAGDGEPFPTSRFPLADSVKLESLHGKGLA